ncbi:hypothetical protein M514_26103 [Trichuris suis]|uniref:Uncharacterized protein n=1 Tax=Trichuris suis TaxID=68888 RepID=A0A085MWV6_9BILA|nr:hypothetical protein M514_26103 [Trichuris suis]
MDSTTHITAVVVPQLVCPVNMTGLTQRLINGCERHSATFGSLPELQPPNKWQNLKEAKAGIVCAPP